MLATPNRRPGFYPSAFLFIIIVHADMYFPRLGRI